MVSQEVKDKLAGLRLGLPSILLPKEGTDYSKWAVIACDQYTSEPEYWETVAAQVGDADSTYKIILPEVFLEKPEEEAVIESVKKTMKEYTESGVFVCWAFGVFCAKSCDVLLRTNIAQPAGVFVSRSFAL